MSLSAAHAQVGIEQLRSMVLGNYHEVRVLFLQILFVLTLSISILSVIC